ncbi:S-layer homology domain-containing protein [Paenibacillus cremeus]|uniref:S-layer homology domain-containing protein n=1 Tax=Paenibacillus cremeus TaxID=2163881 RepID=A0A559K5G5_9BACL|nr:S-layer homology domain-containing protein [Paenibacillus cremeus]TVY07388.1 S-layer homology domain-containing protein [Paenibacillus cremeus]
MRLFKKTLVFLLALIFILGTNSQIASVLAAEISQPDTTVLQNDFIKITVDNHTGRYGIRTVEGQPIRKKDQNVNLMFKGDDPETSFTTFRIDGTDYIFGNPYKFAADFFSEITPPRIVNNSNGTRQIETVWTIKGVEIKQILMLYTDPTDKKNVGNVNIRYEVVNHSGAQVQLGSRMLLDTMVGSNDGPAFQVGTAYKAPLLVERKLVHNPEDDPTISEEDRPLYKLPPYWVMRDTLDLTNPQATNVMAYGFNNFSEKNINIVDEMIVGHWNGLANTKWDYTPNRNLDYTRDTNDYGTADSAVAFYWNPKSLAVNAAQSFETVYGLGEIVEPDKVFSIRYLDPPQQLATLSDSSAYVDEGIFDLNAEIENLPSFNMEHSSIQVQMELESGLSFVKLDEQGRIVRDGNGKAVLESFRSKQLEFRKTATPEEAENGIIPKFKPGDTITASFKVQAKGKPWPTNKQYLLTARSPETTSKLEGQTDEGIKAQYESSKSNFIVLPPIGKAVPTYSYAVSPKETYSTDVKYINVNLTNIDAYTTGNETVKPNFDVYFKEVATGKRYKVPVQSSVLLNPTDDGFQGDMRITYRGGDEVDKDGQTIPGQTGLGPELPLGEYQVEILYKGDTGGDADIATMYNLTTTQTFAVTDNDVARVREASIIAVYKQTVDLSHVSVSTASQSLDEINEAFPGDPIKDGTALYTAVNNFRNAKMFLGAASKALDPEFELGEFTDPLESLKEVPAYNYELFESEEEMDEFFEDEDKEKLLDIRGMIREVGTDDKKQVIVDTKTERAIINGAVAYKGKDMVFSRGKLDILGMGSHGYGDIPFFDTLFVKGEGTLSVASSGFIFHQGEWSLDFFNGFEKTLGEGYTIKQAEYPVKKNKKDNEEDNTLNGSLRWASGALGDRLNPLRQLMIQLVYFNKHSLFVAPSFMVGGFGVSFNDYILREGGISFGGTISMKVVEAEVRNVIFNDQGFVGIDAGLKFDLNKHLGLIDPEEPEKKEGEPEEPSKPSGEINIVHYVQKVEGVNNEYGIKFSAQLKNMMEIEAELSFKQVDDGRVLPDVIAFGTTLPKPGVLITGATYLTAVRGAVRELADTIAGGTDEDPFPLTIEAGVSLKFGVAPAYHFGDIDLTLKRTGIKLEGSLAFSPKAEPEEDDLIPMLTTALLEAQWVKPWFVRLEAEVDVGGWGFVIGKAGIFVGQNLEKHRIDFEGYIGAKVIIPEDVPVVGGLPLASVFFGLNNDKIWGSIGYLFITIGITYYWGGGVEFGTNSEQQPEGFANLLIEDPKHGPRLMVIGQGMKTVATSWVETEKETREITYRDVAPGVKMMDNGTMSVGIGGITVKNSGRVHEIPMSAVSGNGIIEMEYTDKDMPSFTLKDAAGKPYPVVFDNTGTNPEANAYTQFIPAAKSSDKVDHRKAYIIIPQDRLKDGGKWTLTAVSGVETRLINIPTLPQLKEVSLAKNSADANKFTANWAVDNAKPGDTINLYLAKNALNAEKTQVTKKNADGTEEQIEVLDSGDPGMLIAKDLPVNQNGGVTGSTTRGSMEIDATKVRMMNEDEDIRGLLQQGDYYLRAELKSDVAFGTKTSAEKFEIIDPLAPQEVSDVKIEPAGNGYFELSFKPGEKKNGQDGFERSFVINALQQDNGKLAPYPNFGELMFTESELESHLNKDTGRYEGILVGGWTAMTTKDPKTGAVDPKDVKYTGLKVGENYVVGVSAVTKPTKDADKNENYHYAKRIDSANTLLPIPVKPVLEADPGKLGTHNPKIELLTNKTEQSIDLYSDQQDVEVEAFYNNQSVGKVSLQNDASGSHGTLKLSSFTTDGTYGIELRAKNTRTKDRAVKMLYLTVDTIAPVLYLDEPMPGARTVGGVLKLAGTTSNDGNLKVIVNGDENHATLVTPQANGKFTSQIPIVTSDPTAEVTIKAVDHAGNENVASVVVTNDKFVAPAALVLQQMPVMKPGDQQNLQPLLRMADGKDAQGKPRFRDVPLDEKLLSQVKYSVLTGDAITLSDDGKVTAQSTGASLVQASYQVAEGVTLQAMVAASVAVPAPTALETLGVTSTAVANKPNTTSLALSNTGEMLGYQLVYKVFPKGTSVTETTLNQNVSDWSFLPDNRLIPAKNGELVVVAKRTSSGKLAVAASKVISAKVWTNEGGLAGAAGGGGGGMMGSTTSDTLINGRKVSSDVKDGIASVQVTSKNADPAGTQDLVIASQDTSVKGFKINLEQALSEQAVSKQKNITIDLPIAKVVLTPQMLAGMNQNVELDIRPNSSGAIDAFGQIAASVDASMLASGQGISITTNIPDSNWSSYVSTQIPVPTTIEPKDITAVVLQGPNGEWTPLPWKLDTSGNVQVQLTGQGNVVFLQNDKKFSDVDDSFWGKDSIRQAASKLFVLGKDADRFEPESKITRAEYPTMLLRAAGMMHKAAEADFKDVNSSDWFNRSVAIAANMGVVNGLADGSYAPQAQVSRIEAMAMAGRLLQAVGRGGDLQADEAAKLLSTFADGASIPDWARIPVALCIKNGIIEGSNNQINPQDQLTRTQAAAIAVRLDAWITSN